MTTPLQLAKKQKIHLTSTWNFVWCWCGFGSTVLKALGSYDRDLSPPTKVEPVEKVKFQIQENNQSLNNPWTLHLW